jgi:hypothetical protein
MDAAKTPFWVAGLQLAQTSHNGSRKHGESRRFVMTLIVIHTRWSARFRPPAFCAFDAKPKDVKCSTS